MKTKAQYKSEWAKMDRQRRKERGQCTNCTELATPGTTQCEKCRNKDRANHIKYRKRKGMDKYGISSQDYDDMYEKQGGNCLICGRHMSKSATGHQRTEVLVVDHDHKTGKVRGLLCSRCNFAVGHIEEMGWTALIKAMDYLQYSTTATG